MVAPNVSRTYGNLKQIINKRLAGEAQDILL